MRREPVTPAPAHSKVSSRPLELLVSLPRGGRLQQPNFDAPVLCAAFFVLVISDRLFFFESDNGNSKERNVLADEIPLNGLGTPLAETDIVLFRTAGIREPVEFNHEPGRAGAAGDHVQRAFGLAVESGRVELEVHNLFGALRVVVVEIVNAALERGDAVSSLLDALVRRVCLAISSLSGSLRGLSSSPGLSCLGIRSLCGAHSLLRAFIDRVNPFCILFDAILGFLNCRLECRRLKSYVFPRRAP